MPNRWTGRIHVLASMILMQPCARTALQARLMRHIITYSSKDHVVANPQLQTSLPMNDAVLSANCDVVGLPDYLHPRNEPSIK